MLFDLRLIKVNPIIVAQPIFITSQEFKKISIINTIL